MMTIYGIDKNKKNIKVEIEKGKIKKVSFLKKEEIKKDHNNYILPGFIDIHTHGGYGTDFADASEENTRKYLRNLPQEGTTSIVHTSITTPLENLKKSLGVAKKVMDSQEKDETRLIGVNIEGNFLNKAKKGAHKEEMLMPLTKKHIDNLLKAGKNNIKIFSYAIENTTTDVVKYLSSKKINASVAHSIANDEIVLEHLKSGLKGVTHTFNAMTGINHREPGVALSALLEDDLYTEIISDGYHVHPRVIKLLYKNKPIDKLLIITDSAPVKGMPDGEYVFGELKIKKVKNKITLLENDTLAGSISTMIGNFQNFIKYTGCSIKEASEMTSTNQAKYLGLKNVGEIKEGYFADVVVLDENLNLKKTLVRGEVLYERK